METKTQRANGTSIVAGRQVVISRLINAPQSLVFEVWTDPKHIDKWWWPDGFTTTTKSMSVKPGEVWNFDMNGMGMDFPNLIRYLEVVKPEKLVYTHGTGEENDPGEFQVTVTFEKKGMKTLLTMTSLFKSAEIVEKLVHEYNAIESGNQTLDHFEKQLSEVISDRDLVITRVLNAPKELVFKAWSQPDALVKWWGPKGASLNISKFDFRPGGEFVYCMKNAEGFEMWGKFVYHEITAPDGMVFVNSFCDKNGNTIRAPFSEKWPLEIRNILTLEEENGKTTLMLRGGPINATAEELATFEGMRGMMQQGFAGTFEQLDEFLANQ